LSGLKLSGPAVAAARPVVAALVNIADQSFTFLREGSVVDVWPCSTGFRGHSTPKGKFHPTFLSRDHRSSIYNNAPMPFSVFFRGNYAVPGTTETARLGQKASHGCVRLHVGNAATFFLAVSAQRAGDAYPGVTIWVVDNP